MWAGRMRGHAEPLVTTLGTQRNSQTHFGVYYSELKKCSKKKEEEGRVAGGQEGWRRQGTKEGKEGGR